MGADLLAPIFLGVLTFSAGVMLILSGATPAVDWRLAALQWFSPLGSRDFPSARGAGRRPPAVRLSRPVPSARWRLVAGADDHIDQCRPLARERSGLR